jgi:hypothetical protein
VQEGRRALLSKLVDEPSDEERGVTPAPMLGVHADRADLDASIEPHALASHGGQRAVDPNANILPKLMRARTEGAGLRPRCKVQHLGDVRRAKHDWLQIVRGQRRGLQRDHLNDRRFPDNFEAGVSVELVDADQSDPAFRRNQLPQGGERFGRVIGRRAEWRDVGRKTERQRPSLGKPAVAGREGRPDRAIQGAFHRGAQHGRS